MSNQANDPLHGITLKMMLEELHADLGWEGLASQININCFKSNPSVKSSLTFLRKTPWAREKLESLYKKSKGMKVKPTFKPQKKQSFEKDTDFNPWLKKKKQ